MFSQAPFRNAALATYLRIKSCDLYMLAIGRGMHCICIIQAL